MPLVRGALLPLLLSVLAAGAQAQGPCDDDGPFDNDTDQQQACPYEWTQCPDSPAGRVVADLRFDFDADGAIGRCELQCAIDCLNGDPLQEREANQPLSSPDYWDPQPILGGELALDPSVRYEVDFPVLLPMEITGALVIRGNGATVHSSASPAAITRFSQRIDGQKPPVLKGLVLDDLIFEFDGSPAGTTQAALDLFLVDGLLVRNTRVLGAFDVGFSLHAVRGARISDSDFAFVSQHDLLVGGGDECLLADGSFGACCPTCTAADASVGLFLQHLRHSAGDDQVVSIRLRNVDSVIDHASFEGDRARHYVHVSSNAAISTRLRSARMETKSPCNPDDAFFLNEAPGSFVIDGLQACIPCDAVACPAGAEGLFYEATDAAAPSSTLIRSIPHLTAGVRLRAADMPDKLAQQSFAFFDVAPAGLEMDDDARWLPGSIPARIMISDPRRRVLPGQAPAAGEEAVGQVWLDDEGRLKFCCDGAGQVLKAMSIIDATGMPGP